MAARRAAHKRNIASVNTEPFGVCLYELHTSCHIFNGARIPRVVAHAVKKHKGIYSPFVKFARKRLSLVKIRDEFIRTAGAYEHHGRIFSDNISEKLYFFAVRLLFALAFRINLILCFLTIFFSPNRYI